MVVGSSVSTTFLTIAYDSTLSVGYRTRPALRCYAMRKIVRTTLESYLNSKVGNSELIRVSQQRDDVVFGDQPIDDVRGVHDVVNNGRDLGELVARQTDVAQSLRDVELPDERCGVIGAGKRGAC